MLIILGIQCQRPRLLQSPTTIHPNKQTYQYNETITLSCPVGYTLTGEPVHRCQQVGDFQTNLPFCTGK